MTRVVVLGAGGHGREVQQALRADPSVDVLGLLDDREPDPALLRRAGTTWLGPISALLGLAADVEYLIGIGAGETRRQLDSWASENGRTAATFVHPRAEVGMDVELAPGAIVFAFATVTTNVRLGRHAHVGRGCAVGHDSDLGDYVSLYPLAAISGNVTLESGVTVGTTAAIRQGVRIGAGAVVGMGAVVLRDVPPGVTVAGVPAREIASSS